MIGFLGADRGERPDLLTDWHVLLSAKGTCPFCSRSEKGRQALLTAHAQLTTKITQVWPATSLGEACGPHTLTSRYSRVTSSASDFLVEKQLQKCQMCVTLSFLLRRSLEWSPLRRERKARPSSFHLAGKATCPPRVGVTMSTQPPMVSPALGSSLHQPPGFCLSGGPGFLLPPLPPAF